MTKKIKNVINIYRDTIKGDESNESLLDNNATTKVDEEVVKANGAIFFRLLWKSIQSTFIWK